jgi:D-galactarolactone cycloisomerase
MIHSIKTHRLQHKLETSLGFSQWHYDERSALIVEITDSSGAVGWGECYGPATVTQNAIDTFYAPLLLGWDALRNEAAWQHCWRASLDFAIKGPMMGAISGLDMALFDLKGKLLNVSASELMGGRVRDKVEGYATSMYFRKEPEDQLLETLVEEARECGARGFRALKIKIGKNLAFDRKLIVAMREALPGIQLMADSNHAYDLPEAVKIGRLLDEQNYAWFEEPLSPTSGRQFAALAAKVDVPIATGECEQTRFGFQDLLSHGGVHVVQPDLAYCGGPTEALKIRAIASSHGVNTLPHSWGTQLNLASAVHFLATTYVEPGRAEVAEPLLETDLTSNPMRDEMFAQGVRIDRGEITVPTGPGLGVEPDRESMANYCVQQTEKTHA